LTRAENDRVDDDFGLRPASRIAGVYAAQRKPVAAGRGASGLARLNPA
jgi:hypothetical protein